MKNKGRKLIGFGFFTVLILTLILIIGPLDFFTNGYYCDDEFDISVAEDDLQTPVDLNEEGCVFTIEPSKRHLAGFEIRLTNQISDNEGDLVIKTYENNSKEIETQRIPLEKVCNEVWYKIYLTKNYKVGRKYSVNVSTDGAKKIPGIVTIDEDYLSNEIVESNIAAVLAYAHSTFTISVKTLFILALTGIWIAVFGKLSGKSKIFIFASVFIFLTAGLAWVFMFNSMDNLNTLFDDFQEDSETLITGPILAEEGGVWFDKKGDLKYGLGRLYNNLGQYVSYSQEPYNKRSYVDGYHTEDPIIAVKKDTFNERIIEEGTAVRFANGDEFRIISFPEDKKDTGNIFIELDAQRPFNKYKFGNVNDITFILKNGNELHTGRLIAYISQYGLAGRIYRHLARHIENDIEIEVLHLLNSLATAAVLSAIVLLLYKKYNMLLAAICYLTFLLSPWIVNFGRNLYWVEFTWFIPFLVGLFCAMHLKERKMRIISYILAWASIAIKSLCGYEYISVVMMGTISILLIECADKIAKGKRNDVLLLLRTTVIIGSAALMGFMTAIVIHASLRGNGSIMEGIKSIIEVDVLRRTHGANLNYLGSLWWESMNASVWEVFCEYFKFSTEIITGINGNLFPSLCITPLIIFGYDIYKKNTVNIKQAAAYCVLFLTSISWFCLAKSHSYQHPHMNYVVWYFGFVQICIYIIVGRIVQARLKIKRGE